MNIASFLSYPVGGLKHWVDNLSDNLEYRQSVVRLTLISVIAFCCIVTGLFRHWDDMKFYQVSMLFAVYVTSSVIFLYCVKLWPAINHPRRCLAIFLDGVLGLGIYWFMGLESAYYLFLVTWLSIGNGNRYGPKYMIYAVIISFSLLFVLFNYQPEWKEIREYQEAIFLLFIIIAGYIWLVLNQTVNSRIALSQMANQDSLTGMPNRAYMADFMKQIMSQCRRTGSIACCIYFDLDGFKQINDKYGHSIGDKLLIEVARVVNHIVRPNDLAARIAGDEFAVIIDIGQNKEAASQVANRLLAQIESITSIDNQPVDVSASLGVAYDDTQKPCTPDELLKKADIMMYRAKKSGKGQVAIEKF